VLISKAYNGGDNYPHQVIGKPFIAQKGSACTETYLVIGPFRSQLEAENVISYIRTKFFRLLVLLRKSSQNAAQGVYQFVPMQDFSKSWNDEELYAKYGITEEEIAFIDSMIRPMGLEGGDD
jgi:site-specific DNA-methyltransferase (adenine-specific)